jgi:hypothetical protein
MSDILVDNTVARNFCNPLDPHYKAFVQWLILRGVLVVTRSLVKEYIATAGSSPANTSMPSIIDLLTRAGRLALFTNHQLAAFRFPPWIARRLRSNPKDHGNIKAVMLSQRKFALSHDNAFRYDVNNYPGYSARAERRPQDLPYA